MEDASFLWAMLGWYIYIYIYLQLATQSFAWVFWFAEDVQGCADELQELLVVAGFQQGKDRLA